MNKLNPLAIIIPAIALSGWVGYTFYDAYQPPQERIQGQIEAQHYNVSSKVAGRINEVLVRKGDQVNKGQMVFTLLSPELDAKLEQARANEEAADAMAEQALKGARSQEIESAHEQWQKAKAAATLGEKTHNRINNLYKDGVIAEQKKDEAYTKWQASLYTERAAYQMYQMAKEGARDETKRAAIEKARMAAGAVAEVEAYAADTKVKSWHNGEVTQILLRDGELAPQGFPVVSIVDMNDAWAVFHAREDQLKSFRKGTELKVSIPALGEQSYSFKVSHVAAMGDFATWRATDTSQGFDMRTFEIEARPVHPINGLRVGMSTVLEL